MTAVDNMRCFSFCRRSRLWLALLLFLWAAVMLSLFDLPTQRRLPLLWGIGVPAGKVLWLDLRVVAAGIRAQEVGRDPYEANPSDPLARRFNYPRIWLSARFLAQEPTLIAFAVLQSIAAGITLVWLVGKISPLSGLLLIPLLFSPAIVLLVERSNTDLMIFALLGLAAMQAKERHCSWVASLLIGWAAILKLYPAVTLVAVILHPQRKLARILSILVIIGLAVWLLFDLESTLRALEATPMALASYGVSIMSGIIVRMYQLNGHWQDLTAALRVVAALLVIAGIFIGSNSISRSIQRKTPNTANIAFLMSALLYLGTFFASASFDYRLVFLLLGLRYVIRQQWERPVRPWLVSWWLLAAILFWSSPLFGFWSVALHQVASLALVPVLSYFSGRILILQFRTSNSFGSMLTSML